MLLPRDPLAARKEEEDPRSILSINSWSIRNTKLLPRCSGRVRHWNRPFLNVRNWKQTKTTLKLRWESSILLKVFQDILARHKEEVLLEIEREEISMAEMLERLRNMVMSSGEFNLRVFFERR